MDNSETGGTGVKFLEMETSRATYDAGRTNAKVPFSLQVQSYVNEEKLFEVSLVKCDSTAGRRAIFPNQVVNLGVGVSLSVRCVFAFSVKY